MTVRKKRAKLLVKVISDDSIHYWIFFYKKNRLKPDPTPVKS